MFCLFTIDDPIIFEETSQELKWKKAMNEEINVIKRNPT
jgi:hypothetical protein